MSKWMRGMHRSVLVVSLLCASVPAAQAQLEDKLRAMDDALAKIYDGDAVTLAECVDLALLGSSTLGSLEEDLRSAGTDRLNAWAQWLPDFSVNGDWRKTERTDFDSIGQDLIFVPIQFVDDQGMPIDPLVINGELAHTSVPIPGTAADQTSLFRSTSWGAASNWTVFSGFSRFAGISRAGHDLDAAELTLDYQRTLVREQVGNAYLDYVRAILKVGVAEEAEDLASKELEKSEAYFELGISTRSDVLQQKVQLQRNRLETVQARNEMRNAFASLVHLMNIPGAQAFDVETDIPGAEEMRVPELEPLLVVSRENRADLAASEHNVAARSKAVTEARSGFYPSVQVFGNWNRNETKSPQELRFGAERTGSVQWGIQGSWNIFDRFSTKAQSRRAVANRRKAEYDHRQAQLDLEKEIVQLRNNLIESRESFAVATQTVEQSQEELRLAQERFKVGAGTSLDVINAQVGLAQARRDVVDAQTNYAKFWQQLERASGGAVQ